MVSREISEEVKRGNKIVEGSMYFKNLKRYLQYFDKKNMKIKLYDRLDEDPNQFIKSIYSFLKVKSDIVPNIANKKFHTRKHPPKYTYVHSFVKSIASYIKSSGVTGKKTFEYLNDSIASKCYNKINRNEDVPKLTYEMKKELTEVFTRDIRKMSEYLGTDLEEKWLKIQ
jgi:hypothetical protein